MPDRASLLKMFQAGRLHLSVPEHREFIKAELASLASNPDTGDYKKYSHIYGTEVEVSVTKEPEDEPVVETKKKTGRPKKV